MIVLDTDVMIETFEKESDIGGRLFENIEKSGEPFCTTSINLHEILYGLFKYGKPAQRITDLPIINYSKDDAGLSAMLMVDAERMGLKISKADAMIAAIVINNSAALYTLNKKDFKPLEKSGLKLF